MLKIRATKQQFRNPGIAIFIDNVPENSNQQYLTAKPLEMEPIKELYEPAIPLICIEPNIAQLLMDDLWECGLRPSEGTGSAGQLAAVQAHLKDFKTILFKKLNITQE